MTSLQDILGSLSKAAFVDEYYLKLPYSSVGGCPQASDLGNWETLGRILPHVDADILVVRDGRHREGNPPANVDEARRLFDEGYTIVARHAERCDARLAELAQKFEEELAAPADLHLYFTPGGQHGFSWHYDAEDVFILQASGIKEYLLRKNTVQPWPLAETIPPDMGYEHEIMPLVRCTLSAGDWLYVPAGYWHRAESKEDSISLAIGLLSPSAVDLFDFLRPRVLSSLRWRQRLPVCGIATGLTTAELTEKYEALCRDLAADLSTMLAHPSLVRDFLAGKGRPLDGNETAKPTPAEAERIGAMRQGQLRPAVFSSDQR